MANNNDKWQFTPYKDKEPWEKMLDNYDRSQRRRDAHWRQRVVRIDPNLMAQVTDNSGRLNLDKLNNLDARAGFKD